MRVRVWGCRPRVVEVEVEVGLGGLAGLLSKYGEEESSAFAFSNDGEDGDCGERGDSTGEGSSSRMEMRDGEVGSAMAMRAL